MTETMALYREVFRTANEQTFLVDGTSRAGIEAALVSLLEPGDRVLVPVFGRFGHLLTEIAERCGAEVHTVEVPLGRGVRRPRRSSGPSSPTRPKVLAVVQGDTSTTMCQPLADLGEICRRHGVLLYCDATASLGGNPFETDAWGIDVVTAGLQKCLGGPSGSAPITISDAAAGVIDGRKHVEAGHPRGRRPRGGSAYRLELLRPRHGHGLLGPAAAQPPHRGHDDAVRRPRVRPAARRGGARRRGRAAPAARRRRCWPASAGWGSRSSATSRTR